MPTLVKCLFVAALVVAFHADPGRGLAQADDPPAGVVKTVEGRVLVERAGAEFAVEVGRDIHVGDRLRTGEDGAVGLSLSDGTLLSLGRRSDFVLEGFEFAPSRSLFSLIGALLQGRLVYESGLIGDTRPEKVRIETVSGVVATRGTRFAVVVPSPTPP